MQITPPKYVYDVLNFLSASGYTACLVGGCVRDIFLGTAPNDWDIATSALPEQILEIFPDSLTIGMKHGTITVKAGNNLVEVTTFRLDGDYHDHRHPDKVSFVSDLNADLSRRDFTINAMAIAHDGKIVDPFNGLDDLEHGIIRAVGIPEDRFSEDALRMFRAFRFSSRLGFSIEDNTLNAIRRCSKLSVALSSERIRDELEKVLLSQHPEYINDIISLGLMQKYFDGGFTEQHPLNTIRTSSDRYIAWSIFCHFLAYDNLITSEKSFLTELRLDSKTIRICCDSHSIINGPIPSTRSDYKRLLSRYGTDSVLCGISCIDLLNSSSHYQILKDVIQSGECFSIKQLAISGNDLLAMGFAGPKIGTVMNSVLDFVIDNPDCNTRSKIEAFISSKR